ncbi:MAG TPA: hypothetical protein PK857_01425 [Hyphomicrobium sp.]|nr:hypothetical protein [Hyphomicrobium sp.]HRO49454.1 hypothetical protein [Hyphomicrobium sp.]
MENNRTALRRLADSALRGFRKVRTILLTAGLAVAVVALAALTWRVYQIDRDNATIAALAAGDDVEIDLATASDEVVFARSRYLLYRERREEAQTVLDLGGSRVANPSLRARLLYNHANARIRDAVTAIEKGDPARAIPLTQLAKDEYRLALRLDPYNWDIKHNYDVAMRLVRDFPGYEGEAEEVPEDAPKNLWTDLPGVPRGLP